MGKQLSFSTLFFRLCSASSTIFVFLEQRVVYFNDKTLIYTVSFHYYYHFILCVFSSCVANFKSLPFQINKHHDFGFTTFFFREIKLNTGRPRANIFRFTRGGEREGEKSKHLNLAKFSHLWQKFWENDYVLWNVFDLFSFKSTTRVSIYENQKYRKMLPEGVDGAQVRHLEKYLSGRTFCFF